MLKANKKVPIEETIGTGLLTLLVNGLKLSNVGLPEKDKRHSSNAEALPKIRNVLGNGKIMVTPKPDRTVEIKTQNGIIVMMP